MAEKSPVLVVEGAGGRAAVDGPVHGAFDELRRFFSSGRTRPYQWRVAQLKALKAMILENKDEIAEAIHQDLGRCKCVSRRALGVWRVR
jgi:acyl-CoA reductase-like NAD-dependent aldehyde dehydrogenase